VYIHTHVEQLERMHRPREKSPWKPLSLAVTGAFDITRWPLPSTTSSADRKGVHFAVGAMGRQV
jgi:hypothetical protein